MGLSLSSASAQVQIPDTVYVLGDSLNWKLTYRATHYEAWRTSLGHLIPARSLIRCELYRPGASLLEEWRGGESETLFYVPLAHSRDLFADGIELEKTRVFFDGTQPYDRLPSPLERRDAGLLIRGTLLDALYKTDTLRVEVTYSKDGVSAAGGFQRLEIDLAGLRALLPQFFKCPKFKP